MDEVEAVEALLRRPRDLVERKVEELGVLASPLEALAESLLDDGPTITATEVSIRSWADGIVLHARVWVVGTSR